MNQAIQIQDGYDYQPCSNTLVLIAFVSGMRVECHISQIDTDNIELFMADYAYDIEESIADYLNDNPELVGAARIELPFTA